MLLYYLFSNHNITPDEVYAKPFGARAALYGFALREIEINEEGEKARQK